MRKGGKKVLSGLDNYFSDEEGKEGCHLKAFKINVLKLLIMAIRLVTQN